jgi:hypothetical protein
LKSFNAPWVEVDSYRKHASAILGAVAQQTFAGLRYTFAGRKYFLKLQEPGYELPMAVKQ